MNPASLIDAAPGTIPPPDSAERRRRPRARITQRVRVRAAETSGDNFEETTTTVNVSRDGLYFISTCGSYRPGMPLHVAIPCPPGDAPVREERRAEVVRVAELPGHRWGVALRFPPELTPLELPKHRIRATIVYVGSDSRTRHLLGTLLDPGDYNVRLVTTGEEALDELRDLVPAALIAEIDEPEMSGHDLCVVVKRDPRLQKVPVVLLSASGNPRDYSTARDMGATICMSKPLRPYRLLHVINLLAPAAPAKRRPGHNP